MRVCDRGVRNISLSFLYPVSPYTPDRFTRAGNHVRTTYSCIALAPTNTHASNNENHMTRELLLSAAAHTIHTPYTHERRAKSNAHVRQRTVAVCFLALPVVDLCVDDLVQHTIQVRHTLLHTTHWRRLAWLRVCDGPIRVRLGWCPCNTRFIVRREGGKSHDSTSRTLHNELHVNHLGRPPTHLVVEAKRILAGLMRYEIEVLRVPAGVGPRA